jgi:hypothetical protein
LALAPFEVYNCRISLEVEDVTPHVAEHSEIEISALLKVPEVHL